MSDLTKLTLKGAVDGLKAKDFSSRFPTITVSKDT